MPNSANRNQGGNNSSKGQPKHDAGRETPAKPNTERSDIKHNTDEPRQQRGDTSRSSNKGRKESSGGRAED